MANQQFREPADIAKQLEKLKFKKQIFGGVNEKHVWESIEKLNSYYTQVYDYQQAYFSGVVRSQQARIRELEAENAKLRNGQ